MSDTWEPSAEDLFADPRAVDPLAPIEAEMEWLAGTSWRDALDLPLEVPKTTDPFDMDESPEWEADQ